MTSLKLGGLCLKMLLGPILYKLYGFVMYGFRSKLECFSKPLKVAVDRKYTSILQNLSIFCKLHICNVLLPRTLTFISVSSK